MNSLKSVCRFAKGTPVSLNHREKDVESFFGRQTCVVSVVGPLGFVETLEDLGDPLHDGSVPPAKRRRVQRFPRACSRPSSAAILLGVADGRIHRVFSTPTGRACGASG